MTTSEQSFRAVRRGLLRSQLGRGGAFEPPRFDHELVCRVGMPAESSRATYRPHGTGRRSRNWQVSTSRKFKRQESGRRCENEAIPRWHANRE